MANLHPARLGYRLSPFSYCGVDYFDPLYVKVGRKTEKRYGVLFTCLTIRAIHIEIANSLSTNSAILAILRFSSRRGLPLLLKSDNATNFKGASGELKQAIATLDQNKINKFCVERGIEWSFNPTAAPHMGGAWERLVRSVKTALTLVLKDHSPKEEVLMTALTEIEHSINSRPLTHVSVDLGDPEALTPNNFLIGYSSGEIRFEKYDNKKCLRKRWLQVQSFADAGWRRWLREYLPTLISRAKWQKDESPLKVGDLVLILDSNSERNQWKKGVITRAHAASDGQVRVVEVKTCLRYF